MLATGRTSNTGDLNLKAAGIKPGKHGILVVNQNYQVVHPETRKPALGIYAAGDVTDVQTYIDAVRPVAAIYVAKLVAADTVDFNLTILPDTSDNRTATDAELLSTIKAERITP